MITDTRGSIITTNDLSSEDQAEIDKLFDPDFFEKMTKEEWEWTKGMAQAMAYCKNPKDNNSQRCNVRKKKQKIKLSRRIVNPVRF